MTAQRRPATKRDVAVETPRAPRPTRQKSTSDGRSKGPATERTRTRPAEQVPGRFATRTQGIRNIYRDTLAEMKKINWPDQETTRNLTIVVIGISVVLGILLGGMDYILYQLFEAVS